MSEIDHYLVHCKLRFNEVYKDTIVKFKTEERINIENVRVDLIT